MSYGAYESASMTMLRLLDLFMILTWSYFSLRGIYKLNFITIKEIQERKSETEKHQRLICQFINKILNSEIKIFIFSLFESLVHDFTPPTALLLINYSAMKSH